MAELFDFVWSFLWMDNNRTANLIIIIHQIILIYEIILPVKIVHFPGVVESAAKTILRLAKVKKLRAISVLRSESTLYKHVVALWCQLRSNWHFSIFQRSQETFFSHLSHQRRQIVVASEESLQQFIQIVSRLLMHLERRLVKISQFAQKTEDFLVGQIRYVRSLSWKNYKC